MLTDAAIKKLLDTGADRLIPAGGREGLYLRHRATGRKTWVIRRRVEGSWRVETLGDWPKLTALNARRQASITEVSQSAPITFGDAAGDFYSQVIEPRYRSAPKETQAYFTRDCKKLAARRLDKVSRADLVGIVRAKGVEAPNAAVKLLVLLKQFYKWAMIGELIAVSPLAGVTAKALNLPAYQPRERLLTDDEIRGIWALPSEPYGRLLQFLLLTGCRISEAIQFKPEQVSGDVWTIPQTKNGKAHSLPLLPTASGLAEAGWPPRAYGSLHAYLTAHKTDWNVHDLRRSAATRMNDAGVGGDAIEAVLNHSPPKLVRAYRRPDMMPAKREALATLQAVIEAVVKAKT